MPTPSWFCPDTVEGVDEEWEDNCEEEAAEAASVAPSISGSSSGEVKTAPSASPVAAEPGPKGHSPACKGAETAGNHKHKVSAEGRGDAQSSGCFRGAPEDGPGVSLSGDSSQGGACRTWPAHRVARRLAAFRALPYPAQSSQGNSVVGGGRQGLASAPCLQPSVPRTLRLAAGGPASSGRRWAPGRRLPRHA
ncbi:uncharacterized protein LOC121111390 isoform X2 [Gallus gallus]|uniref:uncharacterized protein LOC121111390 isoform X2 n=1 Tax=Gallus gallus TaxID=9031 RepID=UPI001AE86E99|nr:uncharacterized protein LOC121111390 isoform X2 [Gallus gallus]